MAKRNRNKPTWYNPNNTPFCELHIRGGYKGEIAIDIPPNKTNEIVAWCKTTFGEGGNDRRYSWRLNNVTRTRIFLRGGEHQALIFSLRWL